MTTWQLGDVTVGRLGFGAMRLSDPDRAIAVLRRAVELGVNHLDTAAFYGSANELIRAALAPYPAGLVIATKVGPGTDPERGFYNATTAAELREQVETNLRQLGVDRLDVVNLRITGDGSLAERFEWLVALRDEGLIRQLGVSNVQLGHVREALAIAPVVCVQNSYAVDRRGDEDEVIRFCAERGIAYVPFGSITDASTSAAVEAVAASHHVTPQQIRLAWTLHRSPNILAIPGTGSVRHLEENVAAGQLELSATDLTSLG
ncbi:aldo/keto reductase [Kribbella sp. NPDC003557]|uniref:aldo/keto reductase n=1 Tax=Kribbella sp. NPDC003557 TaxID=3154449 RepID=UPI0033A72148